MRPEPKRPDINVTPLVDVVLVLLIIFMVVVPQLDSGAAIDLPVAESVDPESDLEHEPLVVSVTAQGDLFFERAPIDEAELLSALRAAHAAAPGRRLQIEGDRALPYRRARELFALWQSLGFPAVGLEVGTRNPDT